MQDLLNRLRDSRKQISIELSNLQCVISDLENRTEQPAGRVVEKVLYGKGVLLNKDELKEIYTAIKRCTRYRFILGGDPVERIFHKGTKATHVILHFEKDSRNIDWWYFLQSRDLDHCWIIEKEKIMEILTSPAAEIEAEKFNPYIQ